MKLLTLFVSVVLSAASYSNDYQPIFDSCLALKVDAKSTTAQPCRYFVKGFMAASYLTGVPSEAKLDKETSDFFKRAFDTRIGNTSVDKRQQACEVPKNQELIINDVAKKMPAELKTLFDLKLVIIKALKDNQSCGPK